MSSVFLHKFCTPKDNIFTNTLFTCVSQKAIRGELSQKRIFYGLLSFICFPGAFPCLSLHACSLSTSCTMSVSPACQSLSHFRVISGRGWIPVQMQPGSGLARFCLITEKSWGRAQFQRWKEHWFPGAWGCLKEPRVSIKREKVKQAGLLSCSHNCLAAPERCSQLLKLKVIDLIKELVLSLKNMLCDFYSLSSISSDRPSALPLSPFLSAYVLWG